VVLCLLLVGCSAGRDRLYKGAFLPPPPIQAPAPIGVQDADDHHLRNGRREPVFGEREPERERDPPTVPEVILGPPGVGALEKIIWGAKLRRECPDCEEHHLFPQQEGLRALFKDVGIEVNDWAVLIPKDQHRQVHRKDGGYGPGGKWNWDWEQWWTQRKRLKTNADDVFVRVQQMIHEHKLDPYGLPIQYGHGRTISRDLYDIVQPPRKVQ
jgi:hypothetical protein